MSTGRPPFGPRVFTPADAAFEQRVRDSFARQRVMDTIGASLISVAPGEVIIELPFREDLTQQHGYLHAAIVTAIVDSACGYAAYSLMPVDAAVLTVEYKVNFLAPAAGRKFIAQGRVTKPGRTLTVTTGDVFAETDAGLKPIATMLATMMAVSQRETSG
ncbi:PaaI family thioesterase [Corallococcus exiguus]|uniref:PaaI family thioesterase n=1 Tax=Corallococcus TaxID=83461 RepID=UPI000EA108D0|nr:MULTISPECIES: PaaI family thioesterase [Corallococcus]NNC15149.1 PaaI family thioesterase [Corallococcus exiguus]NRD53620.1 PaaI family thioesterase [Corallococcus exiguus]RKH27224.1 PaaI family thioesterase [Corallococcus sp. CA041A]RKH99764.1 PaaI family thioesterase [Corallococcus sp. AB030]RUO94252.1 PaaI family thioesterase [Corallococcus sp. AB018]